MPIHLGTFSSPQTAHWTAATNPMPGKLGSIYETSTYGGQICKLVDAANAAAGDVVYHKKYDGSYEVTPTIGNSSAYEVAGVLGAIFLQNEVVFVQKKGLADVKANGVFADGMPVWPDSASNRVIPAGVFSGSLTAVTATTVGGIFQVANPCAGAALVTGLIINRTTKSTGAGTMDAGTAADATTGSDNLIDGIDMAAAEVLFENNFQNAGTNGKAAVKWLVGGYLNGTASATMAGLVGTYSGTFRPLGFNNLPILGIAQAAISTGKVSVMLNLPYLMRQQSE